TEDASKGTGTVSDNDKIVSGESDGGNPAYGSDMGNQSQLKQSESGEPWKSSELGEESNKGVSNPERINYSRTPESKVPKAKVEEAKNIFSVQKLFNEDTALEVNIYKNLNRSEIGKNVINYIKENGTSVDVIYDYSTIEEMGMQDLKGMQMGNHIYINARNANTIEEISKTIIHEETHLEYDVFGAQWAEAFCDLKAELHAKGELSIADIRKVIKSVKDRYFDYPWRLK
uniref:hypothetical protein n=1 Tax=Clostridium sp. TaxID=1506 RepID=UPI0026388B14